MDFSKLSKTDLIYKIDQLSRYHLPSCHSVQQILSIYAQIKIDKPHELKRPNDDIHTIIQFIFNYDRNQTHANNNNNPKSSSPKINHNNDINIMKHILHKHSGFELKIGLIPIFIEYNSKKGIYYPQFLLQIQYHDEKFRIIDQFGRFYLDFNDWAKNNKLAPSLILIPKDGSLKIDKLTQKPKLDTIKSPSCRILPKLLSASDVLIGVGTVSLGVVSIVTGGLAIPSLFIGGQIIATLYYTGRGFSSLKDKYKHKDKYSYSRKLHQFTSKERSSTQNNIFLVADKDTTNLPYQNNNKILVVKELSSSGSDSDNSVQSINSSSGISSMSSYDSENSDYSTNETIETQLEEDKCDRKSNSSNQLNYERSISTDSYA